MRLATLRRNAVSELVAVDPDGARAAPLGPALATLTADTVGSLDALLATPGLLDRLKESPLPDAIIDLHTEPVEWLPPVRHPAAIVCAGQNFADHAHESTVVASPERPSAFLRLPPTLNGHGASLRYPRDTAQLDYEVEVAAVLGTAAVDINANEAMSYVAGLCLANDLSARDIQFAEARAGSMLLGKNLPGTLPLGPWLTTLDEIEDLTKVELKLQVDGETRQHDVLGSMMIAFPELIAYWSRIGLQSGDLVLSGTPSGVGIFRTPPERYLLQPGNKVTCCSAHLGELTITIADV